MIELPDSYDEWKLREPPQWERVEEEYFEDEIPYELLDEDPPEENDNG